MNHKHQRFYLLFAVTTPRPQEAQLLLEYTGDTARRGTKTTQFVARSLKWNINKVPGGCLGALVSNITGPGGDVRKRIQMTRWTKALQSRVDRLPLEKVVHFGQGCGSKLSQRYQRDGPVPFAAPRESGSG